MRTTAALCLVLGVIAIATPTAVNAQVTTERLVDAESEPGNWLMYSGQYHGQRFSALDQIDRDTVDRLRLRWVRQLPTLGQVQTTPIVIDGVMYLTTPDNEVYALDAETGQVYWTYQHQVSEALTLCCGKQSRGVAVYGNTLYLATLDATDGTDLWHLDLGGEIIAAPMTYLSNGRQQITIAAGHAIFTFALDDGE